MTKQFHPAALLLALSALWLPAQADTVYRCGESYSNSPCAGATVVATDDARSAAQRADTQAAVKRDAALAQAMEKDRLRLEAKAAPAVILASAPAAQAPRASDKRIVKPRSMKSENFTAVPPKKPGEATTQAKKKKKTETA
jgi:hypothetical protein